jgi:protoheme IX farnesyltransferase
MATAEPTTLPAAEPLAVAALGTRLADYAELTKPKIATMALVTVAVGYLLAAAPAVRWDHLAHVLFGAGMVAAGGSALNHWLERAADRRMWRTANRPLPAGRVTPAEALAFGVLLCAVGVGYLAVSLPTPAAAVAATATAVLYVAVYTPLKRLTAWNTVIGAVPGALPPVIGWAAARGTVDAEGLALFAVLFVWQLPHFYSIAWLHKDDYARGGMRMLPVVDRRDGRWTGRATVATCGLLLLATLTPAPFLGPTAAVVYLAGAVPLGVWFLLRAVRFARVRDNARARAVLRGSLVHLCGVMAALVATGVVPRFLS